MLMPLFNMFSKAEINEIPKNAVKYKATFDLLHFWFIALM